MGTRRGLGAWAAVAVTVALAAGLAGCADSAARGLVVQACQHVTKSLTLYRESETEPNAARAARERTEAQIQLQTAAPIASVAAGQAPQWQALMATLSESSRLPESSLVPALKAQCAAVTSGSMIPGLPNTTLPAPPGASNGPGATSPPATTTPTTTTTPPN
jgi:hypothetical protein